MRRLFRDYSFLRLVVFLLVIGIVGSVVLHLTEGSVNEEFGSLPKAAWNIAVYLLSGLDSAVPMTAGGKIAVAMVLVLSLGVVATFTASMASFLVERRLGSGGKMPGYDLRDHIVLCNWNDKGIPIIEELHAEIVKDRRPMVKVSGETNEVHMIPVPDEFIGKPFGELGASLFRQHDTQNPCILVGVVTNKKILLNPKPAELVCPCDSAVLTRCRGDDIISWFLML